MLRGRAGAGLLRIFLLVAVFPMVYRMVMLGLLFCSSHTATPPLSVLYATPRWLWSAHPSPTGCCCSCYYCCCCGRCVCFVFVLFFSRFFGLSGVGAGGVVLCSPRMSVFRFAVRVIDTLWCGASPLGFLWAEPEAPGRLGVRFCCLCVCVCMIKCSFASPPPCPSHDIFPTSPVPFLS